MKFHLFFLCLSLTVFSKMAIAQELTSAQIVQKQVDAYNQRDVEAFLELYTDSIKIYNFPNELLIKGKEEMRARYKKSFANSPDLHSTLISRTILGNTVIDNEYIISDKNKPATELIVIYKVKNQKIVEMYWLRKETD